MIIFLFLWFIARDLATGLLSWVYACVWMWRRTAFSRLFRVCFNVSNTNPFATKPFRSAYHCANKIFRRCHGGEKAHYTSWEWHGKNSQINKCNDNKCEKTTINGLHIIERAAGRYWQIISCVFPFRWPRVQRAHNCWRTPVCWAHKRVSSPRRSQ